MEKRGIFAATLFSFVVFRYWIMTPNVFSFLIFFQIYSLSVKLWFPLHCPSLLRFWTVADIFNFELTCWGILPFVKYAQQWEISVNTVNRVTLIIKLYIATNVFQSNVFKHSAVGGDRVLYTHLCETMWLWDIWSSEFPMYWRRNVQFQCFFPLVIIVSCNKVWQSENEDVHPCNFGFYCDYIIFCVSLARFVWSTSLFHF